MTNKQKKKTEPFYRNEIIGITLLFIRHLFWKRLNDGNKYPQTHSHELIN